MFFCNLARFNELSSFQINFPVLHSAVLYLTPACLQLFTSSEWRFTGANTSTLALLADRFHHMPLSKLVVLFFFILRSRQMSDGQGRVAKLMRWACR